jgi:hypothetical protein
LARIEERNRSFENGVVFLTRLHCFFVPGFGFGDTLIKFVVGDF